MSKKNELNQLNRGFTLIELVIVLAIIIILTSGFVAVFPNIKNTEDNIKLESYEREIEKALAQYYIQFGTQVSQDDVAEKKVPDPDEPELRPWMITLSSKYRISFREGFSYEYENTGLFGSVTIKEIP